MEQQYVKFENNKELFKIDDFKKKCFINGYDDIELLFSIKKKIEIFEKKIFIIKYGKKYSGFIRRWDRARSN